LGFTELEAALVAQGAVKGHFIYVKLSSLAFLFEEKICFQLD
jgi:hypothetical protein